MNHQMFSLECIFVCNRDKYNVQCHRDIIIQYNTIPIHESEFLAAKKLFDITIFGRMGNYKHLHLWTCVHK